MTASASTISFFGLSDIKRVPVMKPTRIQLSEVQWDKGTDRKHVVITDSTLSHTTECASDISMFAERPLCETLPCWSLELGGTGGYGIGIGITDEANHESYELEIGSPGLVNYRSKNEERYRLVPISLAASHHTHWKRVEFSLTHGKIFAWVDHYPYGAVFQITRENQSFNFANWKPHVFIRGGAEAGTTFRLTLGGAENRDDIKITHSERRFQNSDLRLIFHTVEFTRLYGRLRSETMEMQRLSKPKGDSVGTKSKIK